MFGFGRRTQTGLKWYSKARTSYGPFSITFQLSFRPSMPLKTN